jgi:dephospho-CoA kinase
MIKVGLTGGIATGKSTVSRMLISNGFKVIDADLLARDVLQKYPEILQKVRTEFGEGFFDWRGEFRRKEFGNHIFRFPKLRVKYEEIIIPYIKKEIELAFKRYEQNNTQLVVLDAPTLIENNLTAEMDYVILVWADNNTQIQRIKSRDKLQSSDAVRRINSQMSIEEKKAYANIIIVNNGDLSNVKNQVDDIVQFFKSVIQTEGA